MPSTQKKNVFSWTKVVACKHLIVVLVGGGRAGFFLLHTSIYYYNIWSLSWQVCLFLADLLAGCHPTGKSRSREISFFACSKTTNARLKTETKNKWQTADFFFFFFLLQHCQTTKTQLVNDDRKKYIRRVWEFTCSRTVVLIYKCLGGKKKRGWGNKNDRRENVFCCPDIVYTFVVFKMRPG